ncbi:MAG TPA: hypothetical protein VFB20_15675 [Burkholderiales bacterium]|nr:hypothetical protein [Burkholderiales bacterium]
MSIVRYRRDGLKRHWLSLWGGFEANLQFGKLPWLWANIEWGEGYCGGVRLSAGVWWGVWLTIGILFDTKWVVGNSDHSVNGIHIAHLALAAHDEETASGHARANTGRSTCRRARRYRNSPERARTRGTAMTTRSTA